MATRTAAAGGGNWNATGTWVEGAVPTAADDVVFNASSGAVTLTAGAVCRSADANLYANTLTHPAAVTLTIGDGTAGAGNIALRFGAGMTYALGDPATSAITFASTATGQQTVDFGGKTCGNLVFGTSGTPNYAIVSAINAGATASVTSTFGHLHMDGASDNVGLSHAFGKFVASASNVRSLYLGAATFTCNGTGQPWNISASGNVSFDGGTATIILPDLGSSVTGSRIFVSGNRTYYRVRFIGAPESSIQSSGGTATMTVAFYERIGPYSNEYGHISAPFLGTLKITNTYKLWGDSESHRAVLWPGSNAIVANLDLTAATTIDMRYIVVQDINFIRGADLDLSGITGFSSDAGGNTISGGYNLTFTAPVNQDWIASGSGNWSNPANWSSGRVPLCQDPVNITKAFTGSPTITMDCCFSCGPMDVSASTGTVTFSVSGTAICNVINGFKGRTGATFSGTLYWNARGGNRNFQFNGSTVVGNMQISSGNGGNLTFIDSGTLGSLIQHRSGPITIPAGVTIATSSYTSNATTSPANVYVNGAGTLQLTSTGTVFVCANAGNLSNFAGLGRLYISNASAVAKTVAGNGTALPAITFAPGGSGAIAITGNNSMPQLPRPNVPGTGTVTLAAGSTTTLTSPGNDLMYNGSNVVSIKSATGGSAANIVKANGRIQADYVSLQDVVASGGAVFSAGSHSTNVSGNSGWAFNDPQAWVPQAA
ncbi:hypothetical protein [Herbaspirillum frisingense]|uniref:hypothetical protein n=1 Tax=Herbaspirillum frisingense TaxID=92645 RepID=UPI0039B02832